MRLASDPDQSKTVTLVVILHNAKRAHFVGIAGLETSVIGKIQLEKEMYATEINIVKPDLFARTNGAMITV